MVLGVRGGCSGSGGAWRGELSRSSTCTLMYGWSWAGQVRVGGAGWSCGREMGLRLSWVLVVGGPCDAWPSGVLWLCLGGLWTEMGGVRGARSRLVDFWVMHIMVMDETQHVSPGDQVGEFLCVCQQEAFAVYHLGPCSADCF